MERARTRIDDDEWYLDVDPEEVKGEGAVVETEHFFVGQAFNAHLQVFDKITGSMCIGQTKRGVYIHLVCKDTIDEKVMGALRQKADV